jgi:hypothetical protein
MVVRKRKTRRVRSRRTHRRRTQKGGGVLELFSYEITKPEGKNAGKIVVSQDGEAMATLHYSILYEGEKQIAYLNSVVRDGDSIYFRPNIAFLAINKLMEVLENEGVDYIYLHVAARNKEFYKLYNYYRSIGFYCLGENWYGVDNSEETPVAEIFKMHKEAPDYLMEMKPQINGIRGLSERAANSLRQKFRENCGKMIGKVSEIKHILTEKINDIAARMAEVFPNV